MKKQCSPDVIVQVLGEIKRKMVPGSPVTDEDFNVAYRYVWLRESLEMLEWKIDNIRVSLHE